ncbi:hypothetical protein [Rhodopseudomonas palustris]|uniref:hypothetical protein n=1 Tax=Rhodopseudomonas palustris TaxID=1076 RepID=UPI000CEC6B36|nr:hypothetical protein [Rhodopseudomonas palustris]PPQ43152.1 hypothetical protein CKO39_12545 [Rhodopseudomonas palustris]
MNQRAAGILAQLRNIQRGVELENHSRISEPHYSESFDLPSADDHEAIWIVRECTSLIEELERVITTTELIEIATKQAQVDPPWSFGRIAQSAALRPVRLGFVQPVRSIPIVRNVPDIVVAYCLMTIPGHDEFLYREQGGGIGWHYHYLIDRRTRTDTVLCWDTRWMPTNPPDDRIRPLFQELHGEGKAKAFGRPDLWKSKKKKSMHLACAPDLLKWSIDTFRCASNDSRPVWPENAVLTPQAGPQNAIQKAPPKTRGKR